MFKSKHNTKKEEKVVDIEVGLEGNVRFNTPLNLRISGKFEGELDVKGTLAISERADVKVKIIKGEDVVISGKVKGNIVCSKRLELIFPAKVIGNIKAPILIVNEGAVLKGKCEMPIEDEKRELKKHTKKRKGS